MSADKHAPRGAKHGSFCAFASRGGACKCPNNYKKNGKAPASWLAMPPASRQVEYRSDKGNKTKRHFEAHHALSIGPVSAIMFGEDAKDIREIVENTVWCINSTENMLAMPMMAHTVHWYSILKNEGPPPFANIPQHDWEHEPYLHEIEKKLKALIKAVKDKIKPHKVAPTNIESDMKALTAKYKNLLQNVRGRRKLGTHSAYHATNKDSVCHPFSMASTAVVKAKVLPAKKLTSSIEDWKTRILGVSQ